MLKLQKKCLVPFFLALRETDGVLSLKDARIRDGFLKTLKEMTATFEVDRKAIYEHYCVKKEGGVPDIVNDAYTFKPEVQEELIKELTMLLEEEVELPDTKGLKEILEKTEYKPKTGEAELIDEVLAKL